MKSDYLQILSEVVQSSNLNFLLGAGISTPFLPILGNIEKKLNEAKSEAEREVQFKRYLNEVMLPNRLVIQNKATDGNYLNTRDAYQSFFSSLAEMLIKRKSTILSKQVNVFTTNIDILLEKSLEDLLLEYNDGFSGKLKPVFDPSNYKKTIQQRSLHFDHISEIPTFNIIKIHGSLTWKKSTEPDKIEFSHFLDHFNESLSRETGNKFLEGYADILVVNPHEAKHLESVLNLYYSELLRIFSSELEKENATLFVLGFSMDDKHIKQIVLRAAKANPTLQMFLCCSKDSRANMAEKLETLQHSNIHIMSPEESDSKFTLKYFTDNIIKKISEIK